LGKEHDVKSSLALVSVLIFSALSSSVLAQVTAPSKEGKDSQSKPCTNCDSRGFPIWCPQVDILTTANGDLYLCNYYETSCSNIPEDAYYMADAGHAIVDCPDDDKCFPNSSHDTDRGINCPTLVHEKVCALKNKVSMGALPAPFTNSVTAVPTNQYVYIDRSPSDRMLFCIFTVTAKNDNSRRFHIGLQIDWLPPNVAKPLLNYSKVTDYWYTTQLGHEIVHLIGLPSGGSDSASQPTPAKAKE
jgi:hypothetical protein